jgi:hypothetical protein
MNKTGSKKSRDTVPLRRGVETAPTAWLGEGSRDSTYTAELMEGRRGVETAHAAELGERNRDCTYSWA